MFSLIKKDYSKAEQSLDVCIELAKKEDDGNMISYLTQKKGDLIFLMGEREKAIEYYQIAENYLGDALSKYYFARFMADSLRDYRKSIAKCQEVIDLVSSEKWVQLEDDLDKSYYLAQCYALHGYLYALLNDFQTALLSIEKLLMIETSYTLHYDLKLCEILKANGYYSNVKPYLQRLLEKVASSVDHERYADFINSIRQLLLPPDAQ